MVKPNGKLRLFWQGCKHFLQSQTAHDVHSPFVFEFVTEVLSAKNTAVGTRIEAERRAQAESKEVLKIEDLGAGYGGKTSAVHQKTLQQVIRSSARSQKEGELLYRICKHYQPKQCLELGTNLGFSAVYQLSALEGARFISIEGAEALSERAGLLLKDFGVQAELIQAGFQTALTEQIDWSNFQPDYVFIDGDHRYESIMTYFEQILPRMETDSMLILDDIRWSEGMFRAWSEIIAHPEVTISLDLFAMGICFIRKSQAKEHFKFRFYPI